jgi:hypothetical protein
MTNQTEQRHFIAGYKKNSRQFAHPFLDVFGQRFYLICFSAYCTEENDNGPSPQVHVSQQAARPEEQSGCGYH